jgi:2-polyprenyl-3-methyl-5-hydroxy-6-metoxy-1,4-benzoquinol methylase
MSALETREREKYQAAWAMDTYAAHSPGERCLPIFLDMIAPTPNAMGVPFYFGRDISVLDAGAGSGKGALALQKAGFAVTMCDLTPDGLVAEAQALPFVPACLWDDLRAPGRFDYAYCCDVLEHIPTPFTMLVISRLLEVARHSVFLSISTVPDHFGAFVGEPLHQTVQPFVAWRDQIAALGTIVEARDLLTSACFLVRPR